MIDGCNRTFFLQRTHFFAYALFLDVQKERKFLKIIIY
jgi:hypothetical protein